MGHCWDLLWHSHYIATFNIRIKRGWPRNTGTELHFREPNILSISDSKQNQMSGEGCKIQQTNTTIYYCPSLQIFLSWGLPEPNRVSIHLVTCHKFLSCKLLQFPLQHSASTTSFGRRFHQSLTPCIKASLFFITAPASLTWCSLVHHLFR